LSKYFLEISEKVLKSLMTYLPAGRDYKSNNIDMTGTCPVLLQRDRREASNA
jgi:hypothetical protein